MLLLVPLTGFSDVPEAISERWLNASGEGLQGAGEDPETFPTLVSLESQIENGNRLALIPLVWMLVRSGRIETAEAWMEGRGRMVPTTRRDLAIALSWYGRHGMYEILTDDPPIPDDLDDDDYALSIAAIVACGWMETGPDGLFHPSLLAGENELEKVADIFFSEGYEGWDRSWISLSELDELFESGSFGRYE